MEKSGGVCEAKSRNIDETAAIAALWIAGAVWSTEGKRQKRGEGDKESNGDVDIGAACYEREDRRRDRSEVDAV